MKPGNIYQGVSVYYGTAKCHGCGAVESFEGAMRDGVYVPTVSEGARYLEWHTEHVKHRDPNAPPEETDGTG